MGWVRLDDRRALNAKLRRAGFAARGLDEAALCQVAADESDGFVADDTLEMLARAHRERNTPALVRKLVEVGRWSRDEVRGGYWIHDYLDFNESRANAKARRLARSNAGHKGGKRSGEVRAASSKTEASASQVVEPRPDPTRTLKASEPRKLGPAQELIREWSEAVDPPRKVNWASATKIVQSFIDAGWETTTLSTALTSVSAISNGWIENALTPFREQADEIEYYDGFGKPVYK